MKMIDYADVKNLGFKRKDIDDQVWFNEKGYNYFLMTKKINKRLYFDWDVETHEVSLNYCDKDKYIKSKMKITDLGQLKEIDAVLTGKETTYREIVEQLAY